jgi:SCY1-like protein 1
LQLTGFADAVPVIREATVKSVLLLAPKLTDRILNNDLLRHLAKTQMDPEPGIRTNTCILLGRLSKFLLPATNSKVLIPAFSRAVRDAFVHARIAGLMALMATMECYSKEDLAGRVLPAMSITMVDKEKLVRDQAFKAMDIFIKRLETIAASMVRPFSRSVTWVPCAPQPETVQPPGSATQLNGSSVAYSSSSAPSTPSMGLSALPTSASGAAGALAGWAMTNFAKKVRSVTVHWCLTYEWTQLMPSDLATGIGGLEPPTARPSSTPPAIQNGLTGTAFQPQPSPLARPSSATQPAPIVSHAPAAEPDLMNVTEDDWDPLEAFSEPMADSVDDFAPEEPEPDFFAATLHTSPRKPSGPSQSALKLTSSKPGKVDAFLDGFGELSFAWRCGHSNQTDDAHWDDVSNAAPSMSNLSTRSSTPSTAVSHQKRTTAGGWNDPPPTLEVPVVKAGPKAKAKTVRAVSPLLTGEAESWSDFDQADQATDSAWSSNDKWDAPPAKGDSKSKMARMREERKAVRLFSRRAKVC